MIMKAVPLGRGLTRNISYLPGTGVTVIMKAVPLWGGMTHNLSYLTYMAQGLTVIMKAVPFGRGLTCNLAYLPGMRVNCDHEYSSLRAMPDMLSLTWYKD